LPAGRALKDTHEEALHGDRISWDGTTAAIAAETVEGSISMLTTSVFRHGRPAIATATVAVLLPVGTLASSATAIPLHHGLAAAPTTAPGAPGGPAFWTNGAKTGFGTARGLGSKVWYTLNSGKTTELFYPRIDTPSVRDSQLLVTDGRTFTDREDRDTVHATRVLDRRGLTYRVVNTAKSGAYRITKTYVTDPARSTVLVDITFTSLTGKPYKIYVLHDPALGNDGTDDTAGGRGATMVSSSPGIGSGVAADPAFTRISSGYLGVSDGWTDLRSDHRMDWSYVAPHPGNVVQTGETALSGLPGHRHLTLAIGFGGTAQAGSRAAHASLTTGFASVSQDFAIGWRHYLKSLDPVPQSAARWQRLWRVSAMVLAASEDKTYRGGFVAAPARPWAWGFELRDLPVYHAVWARDLYQIATGLLADGDVPAANRALTYLWTVQQRPDGSFPQNSRLDGAPVFTSQQMDEVAFPIILAQQLGRTGPSDWAHVRLSANYLAAHGPASPQERWENLGNYSPATIAAEIAGLVCASDIARDNGARAASHRYLALADAWRANLDAWTRTTTGPLSDRPYYLRVSVTGDANAGTKIQVPDGGPLVDERRIVDPSFLELVRLGVIRADDRDIRSTLAVVDRTLRFSTPNGPFWHRSSFDGYGEKRDGSMWEPTDDGSRQTLGRGWPLLTGERGEYELAAGDSAQKFLDAMAKSASNPTGLMSEQVWDKRPPVGSSARFRPGEGTFSARPLAWTHAQFLRLARSIDAGRPVETPDVVACRYHSELCRASRP
jgi:glucoamylase